MNYVYIVHKNTQQSDSDGWHWWIGSEMLSVHATNDGALARIERLIVLDLETLRKEWNEYPERADYALEASQLTANSRPFKVGEHGDAQENAAYYFIQIKELED